MATVAVSDTTLCYERSGAGPELLFIHGMCGHAGVWDGQVQRLADQFTCLTYDRRGHSRSGPSTRRESVATHAEDAAALIGALRLDRPVLVGSSGGARIALELARTHPELVSGGVFSEPPVFSLEPAAGRALQAEIAAVVRPAAEAGGPRAAVDAFFAVVCPGLWSALDEPARDRYRANGHMMLAELAGEPYALDPTDVTSLDLPALVITGTDSHPAFQAIAVTLAHALPDARLVRLPGSGHVTYAERPDEFASAVREFAAHLAGSLGRSRSLR